METEIWKAVEGPYRPGYEVSNLGRVRGSERNRRGGSWAGGQCSTRQGTLGNRHNFIPGYCKVSLRLAGSTRRKLVSVHRLVAMAFVPGDHSLDVNHKDMNKANNHWTNLEWVTHAENQRHGFANHPHWIDNLRTAAGKRRKPIIRVTDGAPEVRYDSVRAAARACGRPEYAANIWNAAHRGTIAYGSRWRFPGK